MTVVPSVKQAFVPQAKRYYCVYLLSKLFCPSAAVVSADITPKAVLMFFVHIRV